MTTPARPAGSPSLTQNPRLARWLEICSDGHVLVRSGKVELGQGVLTALAQIAAEELDVDVSRVRMVATLTGVSPDESYTAGSLSIQHSGSALRAVCADVRARFVEVAASKLDVAASSLAVTDGDIIAPDGRRLSYWDLAADVCLNRELSGTATPKSAAAYATVGTSVPRTDLYGKVTGRPTFIHDLRLPGQLYGRVVRPPARTATLVSLDESRAQAMADVVAVVRDGSFVAVVASREDVAVLAVDALAAGCSWDVQPSLPDEAALEQYLLEAPATRSVLHGADDPHPDGAATTTAARFSRPYLAHASMAPSCGIALWDNDELRVWSHSQGVYNLGNELSRQHDLAPSQVIVEHVQGAGCYGHNAADDAAYDATLLARAVPGRPVQVVWSRPDELGWSPLGPAMTVQITVGRDPAGGLVSWQHDIWSNGHAGRPWSPGHPPMLAAMHQDPPAPVVVSLDPALANGGGSGRNAVPLYDLPAVTVVSHRLDLMPLRTSALRALGAHLNVFAIEAVIDDLALAAGLDPLEYRIGLLRDQRAINVLRAVATASGWGESRRGSGSAEGRGIGFARYKNSGAYCAVVADVEAEAEVKVTRLAIAVDVGLAVNPDGVVNQIEGGALQAISWTVKEQVRFDRERVTSTTWEDYPILRFSEAPPVGVVLVQSQGELPLGAGEASIGPTAAAIGNAVHDALGVRVRNLPLTQSNVIAAMA